MHSGLNLACYVYHVYRFCGGNWVPLERGGNEGWDLRVRGNLTRRPDGRINTSPIALVRPVFKLQQGCGDVIRIPGMYENDCDSSCIIYYSLYCIHSTHFSWGRINFLNLNFYCS